MTSNSVFIRNFQDMLTLCFSIGIANTRIIDENGNEGIEAIFQSDGSICFKAKDFNLVKPETPSNIEELVRQAIDDVETHGFTTATMSAKDYPAFIDAMEEYLNGSDNNEDTSTPEPSKNVSSENNSFACSTSLNPIYDGFHQAEISRLWISTYTICISDKPNSDAIRTANEAVAAYKAMLVS